MRDSEFRVGRNVGLIKSPMRRRWKKIRYRFEWFGLVLLTYLVPLLPRRAVVVLAKAIGSIAFRLDGRGRAVALANIAAAFGDKYTPEQRIEIARKSYQGFGRTMCDLFWAKALTPKNYRRYIHFENLEVLQQLRARGESAVMVCIHHGNFEWASLAVGFEGVPVTIVTESFKNARVAGFFRNCRQVSGHCIIPQEASMIRLFKHVRKGGVAGMLADLNLRPGDAATVIDAFGMKMCVTFLHAVLAQRGPARLVPTEGISLPDGTCRVVFHPPLEVFPEATLQQIAQQCWDFFEPTIRAKPEDWLWAYKHWRFQPSQTTRAYPFYAHPSVDFDALLARVAAEEVVSRAA